MMIKNLDELVEVYKYRCMKLEAMDQRYLNDRGRAAIQAYRDIIYRSYLHDDLLMMSLDNDFLNLFRSKDKDPEYYLILHSCIRDIALALKE